MKLIAQVAIASVFFLTSCYSFNRIEIKPTDTKQVTSQQLEEKIQTEATQLALKMVEDINKNTKASCPIFSMPALPKTPELPYKELSKIQKGDIKAILELEQDHIEDLRTYIILIKQIVQKAQLDYIANCQTVQK
jgi:hypothetical protein